MNPTWCEECEHVESGSRKSHPARWLCIKFPRMEGHGFVSRQFWSEEEPFMRCVNINGGACPLFSNRAVLSTSITGKSNDEHQ